MTIWCELVWLQNSFQPATRITLNEYSTIVQIETHQQPHAGDKVFNGLVVPGFINAHCHLELSHLQKKIPPKTGMAGFIERLQKIRNSATIQQKINSQLAAIQELKKNGVVAIADICNSDDSRFAKEQFPEIQFHHFIEIFGLSKDAAIHQMNHASDLLKAFYNATITPHAPYSAGPELLRHTFQRAEAVYSIHLLESEEEKQLFEQQEGALWELFSSWNLPVSQEFYQKDIIKHISQGLPNDASVLWVHNNYLTEKQIETIVHNFPNSYFCLCPRANMFIHNKFPEFSTFYSVRNRLCLGTDSLAGTTSFDLLADAKIITDSNIFSLGEIINMLTINPAQALHWSPRLGSFEVGKSPGFNQLYPIQIENPRLLSCTGVQPIIV